MLDQQKRRLRKVVLLHTFMFICAHFYLARPQANHPHVTCGPPSRYSTKQLSTSHNTQQKCPHTVGWENVAPTPIDDFGSTPLPHSSFDRTFVHTHPCPHLHTNNHRPEITHKEAGGMSNAHPARCAPSGTHAPQGFIVISGYDAWQPRETGPQSRRFQPGHPGQPHRYQSWPAAERAKG